MLPGLQFAMFYFLLILRGERGSSLAEGNSSAAVETWLGEEGEKVQICRSGNGVELTQHHAEDRRAGGVF